MISLSTHFHELCMIRNKTLSRDQRKPLTCRPSALLALEKTSASARVLCGERLTRNRRLERVLVKINSSLLALLCSFALGMTEVKSSF